jgi:hypothetical protein
MRADADKIKSRAKQRAQQIQRIQAGDKGWPLEEDLGSPAEDDDADAATLFAHEVKRAERRARAELRRPRGTRPR